MLDCIWMIYIREGNIKMILRSLAWAAMQLVIIIAVIKIVIRIVVPSTMIEN